MARLWSCGFELNHVPTGGVTEGIELGFQQGATDTSIATSPVRSGAYSLKATSADNTQSYIYYRFSTSNEQKIIYYRVYFRTATTPADKVMVFDTGAGSSFNDCAGIWMDTNRQLQLRNVQSGSYIGNLSSALALNTWYRVELKIDNTTPASTILEARLDGTVFGTATTDTSTPSAGAQGVLYLGNNQNVSHELYYDDVAVNDTSGAYETGYPGEGNIIHLRPSAAGDTDAWDLTTTYEDIDEVTPDDATTIISSLTSGETHEVNIDATPAVLGYADKIKVLHLGVRFNESIGTDPDPTFVLRIKDNTNGTVEESSTITASSTSYNTNATAVPRNYVLTLYNLPGTDNQPWSKYALDTTQIGVRLTNTPVGLAQVSTLWLLVEYESDTNKTPHNYERYLQVGQGISRSESAK